MIDVISIGQEIYRTCKRLDKGSTAIGKYAVERAKTERDYIKKLALEKERLRDEGLPVTLIDDIAKGNISDVKSKRDLAKFQFEASKAMLDALKAEMSGLQSLYKRQEEI